LGLSSFLFRLTFLLVCIECSSWKLCHLLFWINVVD
jgi:hypothetical protein